jgi:hypothetical protein
MPTSRDTESDRHLRNKRTMPITNSEGKPSQEDKRWLGQPWTDPWGPVYFPLQII